MTDLEIVMQRADGMGITYRSDIKIETLSKKIADKLAEDKAPEEKPVETKPDEVKLTDCFEYKNTTKNNVFTEAGRCSPQRMVMLTPGEAANHAGLELCEK